MRFASVIAATDDPREAEGTLIERLAQAMAGPVTMMMLFVTPEYADALDRLGCRLLNAFEPDTLLGVTCEGVLGVRRELHRRPGVAAIAASMPGATVQSFRYAQIDWPEVFGDPRALKQSLGMNHADIRGITMVADPFSTPMVKLLPAFNAAFPGIPLAGGMASGSSRPQGNRIFIDGEVLRDGAAGIAFGGNLRVDNVVSQGCRAVGKPFVITKTHRHIVHQLGGRPALAVAREVAEAMTDADRELVKSKGLLLGRVINEYQDRFGRGDFLIRNLIGFDQDAGYIAVNDTQIRVGQTVQFHVHDKRTAEEDLRMLLDGQRLHGAGAGALLFSCNGRGVNLFDRPDADAEMIHAAFGDMPLAGFFAAGEIGPIGGVNFMHGHTASLMLFRDPPSPEAPGA